MAHGAEPSTHPASAGADTSGPAVRIDFAELYLTQYSRLVRALIIAGADAATAQDLAQEAFARTYQHWRRVRSGTNPAGYLHTIAFRLLRRRRPFTETSLDDTLLADGPSVEEAAINADLVRKALQGMTRRQQECVALTAYLGYSTEEAATLLGISPSTVRVQLHRARQKLKTSSVAPLDSPRAGTDVEEQRPARDHSMR